MAIPHKKSVCLRVLVLHPGITPWGNDPEWLKITRFYPEMCLNGVNAQWVYSQSVISKPSEFGLGSIIDHRSRSQASFGSAQQRLEQRLNDESLQAQRSVFELTTAQRNQKEERHGGRVPANKGGSFLRGYSL